ncbi:MAG TPA: TIGR03790 family protein, partial [Verrucomicrobiae bacterium]
MRGRIKVKRNRLILFSMLLLAFAPGLARAGGDEVVVIYNSRLPESRAVAEHYAAARQVPARQVFGFGLTTNEVMSRADFTELLQKPLADRLEAARLWKFGEVTIPGTNGEPALTEIRVVNSKIRYAVLCYGVPLK